MDSAVVSLTRKKWVPIRFLEDSGMSTPISLPSEGSAEAGPRSPSLDPLSLSNHFTPGKGTDTLLYSTLVMSVTLIS